MAMNCHEALCTWAGCDHPPHCMANSLTEDSLGGAHVSVCVLAPNHPPPCAFGNPSLACPRCNLVSPAAAHRQLAAAVQASGVPAAVAGDLILCMFCGLLARFGDGGDLRPLTKQELREVPVDAGRAIVGLIYSRAHALLETLR